MVIVTGDASGTAICSVEPTNRDAKVNGDEEIHVLHRSEHFLVVDKPADLVINTQKAHEHPVTVETLLRRQCPELIDPSVEHGFRFCHRLDFATSGVLCLALTRAAARAAQVRAKGAKVGSVCQLYPAEVPPPSVRLVKAAFGPPLRTARKCYAALLDGHVAVPAGWCGIEIELAVGNDRREGHRHKMCTANVEYCVNARGAVTRLLVLGWGLFHGRATTQVLLRQLQTGSLPSQGLMHRMYPETYPTHKCRVCRRETADYTHILWDYVKTPEEAKSRTIPPWLEASAKSCDQYEQLWAVQQVLGALVMWGPSEHCDFVGDTGPHWGT
ncbi:uncharacterized protein LOC142587318 isoform X2 [Dermacentor variabilis]|uniref:uncharacterized protein LOC142587318 isoform X2 n=1 Tax=Dermacentor variabilis TaxID=34621 RepID=UPI003F5C5C9C